MKELEIIKELQTLVAKKTEQIICYQKCLLGRVRLEDNDRIDKASELGDQIDGLEKKIKILSIEAGII